MKTVLKKKEKKNEQFAFPGTSWVHIIIIIIIITITTKMLGT